MPLAEGIETPGQLAFLRENGCTLGQGFLFSVPLDAEELVERYGSGATLSGEPAWAYTLGSASNLDGQPAEQK